MSQDGEFVRNLLHLETTEFRFSLESKDYVGWYSNDDFPTLKADELVERHWRACSERDMRLFFGYPADRKLLWPQRQFASWRLFAVPRMPTLDILEFCQAGPDESAEEGFNSMLFAAESIRRRLSEEDAKLLDRELPKLLKAEASASTRDRMAKGLRKIFELSPFEIGFANPAGLYVRFIGQISPAIAKQCQKIILDFNPEATEVTDPVPLHQSIRKQGAFRLLWQ